MHAIKPNTRYKLVTLTLACPEDITEAGMADGLNEMLNGGLHEHPGNCAYADWTIDFSGPVKTSGAEPEEGELFNGDPELPDGDYILKEKAAWFTVGPLSVRINGAGEGVVVDIYPHGREADTEAIASAWALYDDAHGEPFTESDEMNDAATAQGDQAGVADARRHAAHPADFEPTPNPYGMDSEPELHEAWADAYENTFELLK